MTTCPNCERLRSHLKAIADHHEEQRIAFEEDHMHGDAAYHEQRRDVAMFPLVSPEERGEVPLFAEA